MWHAGHNYTKEEKEVLRELEYDLFMYNPGFRSMWHNNFEKYFEATFDEEKWEQREEEREKEIAEEVGRQMIEDPDYATMMHKRAVVEEALFGDLDPVHVPIEMRADVEELKREIEESDEDFDDDDNDPLYMLAKNWGMNLMLKAGKLLEQKDSIHLFRILTNCTIVPAKITGAGTYIPSEGEDFEWRIDRACYNLALSSMLRCLESMEKLQENKTIAKKLDLEKYLHNGREIKQQLIDRLDTIEQERFKR